MVLLQKTNFSVVNTSSATSTLYCAMQLCCTWQSRLPSLPHCLHMQTVSSHTHAMWIPTTEANGSRAATIFVPFFSQRSIEGWGATPPATCLSSQQSHHTPRPHRWKLSFPYFLQLSKAKGLGQFLCKNVLTHSSSSFKPVHKETPGRLPVARCRLDHA